MTKLNDYTEETKENIHLLVTPLCDRKCPYCCNKQYDLDDVPHITKEELKGAKNIFLTGGEPFTYSVPNAIAKKLKQDFPNIEKVFVYTNAKELYIYLETSGCSLGDIDGLTVSIKDDMDVIFFEIMQNDKHYHYCDKSNWLYTFGDDLVPANTKYFKHIPRTWQADFQPDPNSIFRRL